MDKLNRQSSSLTPQFSVCEPPPSAVVQLDLELKHGAVSDTFQGNFSYFQPWTSFPCFCQKYVCFQIFNNYLIINTEQMEPFTSQKN